MKKCKVCNDVYIYGVKREVCCNCKAPAAVSTKETCLKLGKERIKELNRKTKK